MRVAGFKTVQDSTLNTKLILQAKQNGTHKLSRPHKTQTALPGRISGLVLG